MKEEWITKPFLECIENVTYSTKINKKEFLPKGRFPIISQEENFINGYWENESDVYKVEKPVVIFGDHTKILKFIDFNFVLGADGVKILKPREFLIPKFFYYFLYSSKLPDLGYARHFKLLKELIVSIPPLHEQRRIVEILDQSFAAIDQAIENTEKNISESQNLFDNYLDNIFYNNDHWKTKKLGDICFITDGTHYSPKNNQFGEYKYITAKNIKPFELDLSNITFISKEDHEKIYLRCPVKKGDILYIKDGATTGNAAINTIDEEFSLLSSVALIKPVDFINNDFLVYYMNSNVGRKNFLGKIGGVAITRLTIEKLKNIFISFPSVDQQENYVQKFKKLRSEIEELKRIYSSKLLLLQELKQSILHKAFNGDL